MKLPKIPIGRILKAAAPIVVGLVANAARKKIDKTADKIIKKLG